MNINIKATNLELTPAIRQYVEVKFGGLSRFLQKLEKEGEVNIFIEIARSTHHHHKGDVFYAEANLKLPGRNLRAEHQDWNIRVAIDKVRDKLQQKIKKYKEKQVQSAGNQ